MRKHRFDHLRNAHEINPSSVRKATELAEAFAWKAIHGLRLGVRWDHDGILSAARAGVAMATQTYDPQRGASFASWACNKSKYEVFREIEQQQPGLYRAKIRSAKRGDGHFGSTPITMLPNEMEPLEMDGMTTLERERLLKGSAPPPDEEIIAADEERRLRRAIQNALRRLRPQDRQIIRMRFFKQKTLREIGDQMGCSRENVRLHESQALRALRSATALADWA